jgi:ABC-2 type transport system ATP-binding protein
VRDSGASAFAGDFSQREWILEGRGWWYRDSGAPGGMIIAENLTKRFGSQIAVNALSFEIPAGQIVGFLGPNGAGKSTTLKMLTGMLEPSDGSASICGFDVRHQVLEVKGRVGFVPESAAVFESLTGLEYLEMVAALYGIPRSLT